MLKKVEKILQYPDPILKQKTKEIKKIDNDIINLLGDLKRLAKENSKDGITLVGLSAPQVGYSFSVFVFYDFKLDKYVEVINPKLIYSSKELSAEWEGCASVGVGENSLFGPVRRAKSCQIRFTDIHGEEKSVSASNYQSHIILHEIDHLNGILFIDRVDDPKMILTAKELDRYANAHGGKYPKVS